MSCSPCGAVGGAKCPCPCSNTKKSTTSSKTPYTQYRLSTSKAEKLAEVNHTLDQIKQRIAAHKCFITSARQGMDSVSTRKVSTSHINSTSNSWSSIMDKSKSASKIAKSTGSASSSICQTTITKNQNTSKHNTKSQYSINTSKDVTNLHSSTKIYTHLSESRNQAKGCNSLSKDQSRKQARSPVEDCSLFLNQARPPIISKSSSLSRISQSSFKEQKVVFEKSQATVNSLSLPQNISRSRSLSPCCSNEKDGTRSKIARQTLSSLRFPDYSKRCNSYKTNHTKPGPAHPTPSVENNLINNNSNPTSYQATIRVTFDINLESTMNNNNDEKTSNSRVSISGGQE